MRLSLRSHLIFVTGLLLATFGIGQIWGLATSLRGGSADLADIVTGGLGFLLVVVASIVLGRFMYVHVRLSRSLQEKTQEVYNGSHK